MSRILLHICCAPCSAFSVPALRGEGLSVTGYFFNPNIHPDIEHRQRTEALRDYQPELDIEIDFPEYDCGDYFSIVRAAGDDRCRKCYTLRLGKTAREAKRKGSDAFSTTLLFSIYQKHDLLREVAERVAGEEGIPFLYRDLRPGWQEGGQRYRESGLYRQNYCGCIFSEKERIDRTRQKR